jgi:AcrR family transcriptional regulator
MNTLGGVATHTARRRGRHAEGARNDQRLLDAARDVFAAQGTAATVAAIAARAGLGIGSLYRRYGGKTELLQHLCLLAMQQAATAAGEALAEPDADAALTGYIRACVALRTGALAPLAGTIETTPQMRELSRQGRRLHQAVVDRAHREGHLRPDATALDISWMIEQFARTAPPADASDDDRNVQRRLLAIAIDGLYATGALPLPGHPPTPQHYVQRWQFPPAPEDARLRLSSGMRTGSQMATMPCVTCHARPDLLDAAGSERGHWCR